MQREKIVNGVVEPTDEECDWPSDEEEEEGIRTKRLNNKPLN